MSNGVWYTILQFVFYACSTWTNKKVAFKSMNVCVCGGGGGNGGTGVALLIHVATKRTVCMCVCVRVILLFCVCICMHMCMWVCVLCAHASTWCVYISVYTVKLHMASRLPRHQLLTVPNNSRSCSMRQAESRKAVSLSSIADSASLCSSSQVLYTSSDNTCNTKQPTGEVTTTTYPSANICIKRNQGH